MTAKCRLCRKETGDYDYTDYTVVGACIQCVIKLVEREAARERDDDFMLNRAMEAAKDPAFHEIGKPDVNAPYYSPVEAEAQPMWKEERAFQRRIAVYRGAVRLYATCSVINSYEDAAKTANDLMREVERSE